MKTLNIGRNATNEIILEDKMISRQHAQLIILDNGQILIKDLGSSNGTFVNGNKISECYLKMGDIVKCGSTFLNWSQYVNNSGSPASAESNLRNPQQSNIENLSKSNMQHIFTFEDTIKYLTTKIFNIGDLFKTEWDRTTSILFFSLVPYVISIIVLLFTYMKTDSIQFFQNGFGNQVIAPFIGIIFYYGVSQFLSISLLSLRGVTTIKKNLLASSILSFLMCMTALVSVIIAIPLLLNDEFNFDAIPATIIIALLMLPIYISLMITMVVLVYKYFRAIGIENGISIHFTVLAFFLNIIFQLAFTIIIFNFSYNNAIHNIDILNFIL